MRVDWVSYITLELVTLGDRSHAESRLEGNFETVNLICLCGTSIVRVKVIETFLECLHRDIFRQVIYIYSRYAEPTMVSMEDTTLRKPGIVFCVRFVTRRKHAQIRVISSPVFHDKVVDGNRCVCLTKRQVNGFRYGPFKLVFSNYTLLLSIDLTYYGNSYMTVN